MVDEEFEVEAIQEGRIVRVSEEYARKEGLLVLKKFMRFEPNEEVKEEEVEDRRLLMDDFRKPLDWKDKGIAKELIDNFYWHISRERRRRGITRGEFAKAIGESENTIKMIPPGWKLSKEKCDNSDSEYISG